MTTNYSGISGLLINLAYIGVALIITTGMVSAIQPLTV